ncbi:PREDICTED: uncharacterized protein LOC104810820 isoform X2 [Tarenaya hassleriana]|uniref:uncharacterized protein LOC104810820 isoform X2 n=1 Tax=Tarenaya hassleriana TaxID=28532 RepID=UPI00053C0A04|nr:PREDICTED: uncharacterized protein LOC104810820 isoform X2 [Tarenaya hassleriana]
MCGHVSAAVASERCPCVVGCSGDVVFPPPPQEQFPPLQLLLNYHELMIDTSTAEFDLTGESAKFYCFSGGSVSGCDSPSSLGSGGEGKQSAARHTSVNSNDGYLSNFISAHGPTFDSGPIRRAHSAGDVHRVNKKGQQQQGRRGESELWSESNAIIQGMNRTAKYSPEEKKERIERYRSKRNLRNFNKRIKEDTGGGQGKSQGEVCEELRRDRRQDRRCLRSRFGHFFRRLGLFS